MIFKFTAGKTLNNNQVIKPEKGILGCHVICPESLENYNSGWASLALLG